MNNDTYLAEVRPFLSAAAYNVLREIVRTPGQTTKQIATVLNVQLGKELILLREADLIESHKEVTPGVRGKAPCTHTPTMKIPSKKVRAYRLLIPRRPAQDVDGDAATIVARLVEATSDIMELWPANQIRLSLARLQQLLQK